LRYLKTFVIVAPVTGLLAHYFAEDGMRWWPDTFIFGGFVGAMAAFVVMRVTHARRALGHLHGAGKAVAGKITGKQD
jgi:hypothetical protein